MSTSSPAMVTSIQRDGTFEREGKQMHFDIGHHPDGCRAHAIRGGGGGRKDEPGQHRDEEERRRSHELRFGHAGPSWRRRPTAGRGEAGTVARPADFFEKTNPQILTNRVDFRAWPVNRWVRRAPWLWAARLAAAAAARGGFCISAISDNNPAEGPGFDCAPSGLRWRSLISAELLANPRAMRRPGVGGEACR
jgi:hypothetical protein